MSSAGAQGQAAESTECCGFNNAPVQNLGMTENIYNQ